MKVSIIIPVYNVERYVIRCLESVIAQKAQDIEIECVLIDDFSSDNSRQLVQSFVDSYNGNVRFVLIFHKTNRGPSAARNTGVEAASGDFIFFLDADDRISINCISKLVAALKEHPKADFAMGNIFRVKEMHTYMSEKQDVIMIDTQKELFLKLYEMKIPCSACNRLIRREVFQNSYIRFVDGLLYEDMLWNYHLFLTIHSIVILPDVTYIYEDNGESIVNTTISRPNVVANSFCFISNDIICHISPCLHSNCLMYAFTILLKAIDVHLRYTCDKEVFQCIKKSKLRLMGTTLRHGRFLLAFFFLLMYKPFCYLLLHSYISKKFHRMSMLIVRIENVIDIVFGRK